MNKIVLYFNKCSPAPAGGYKVYYRVAGSDDPYTSAGTFYNSPAIFYDTINPAGTCYEGYMVTDCGDDVMGNHIPFETCTSDSGFDNSSCGIILTNTTSDSGIVDYGLTDLHVDGAIDVHVLWSSFDRPNRFTIYEDGDELISTGWKGYAPYIGPWGASLSTTENGDITFSPVPGRVYQIRVEAGPAGPPPYNISDNYSVSIICNL